MARKLRGPTGLLSAGSASLALVASFTYVFFASVIERGLFMRQAYFSDQQLHSDVDTRFYLILRCVEVEY